MESVRGESNTTPNDQRPIPKAALGVGSWELEVSASGRADGCQRFVRDRCPVGRDRVIAAMAVRLARLPFFLDVRQLAIGRKLTIPADDTPTTKCSEPKEPHQTHGFESSAASSGASSVPAEVLVCASHLLDVNRAEF